MALFSFHANRAAKTGESMADDTTTAESGNEKDTATTAAAGDGSNSGTERTFTQADLDRIVTERLAKEKQRNEAAMAKAKTDSERKAAEEQGQWRTLAEQYKTEAETERQRAQAASLAILRRDIAAKLNVPAVLADRLRGDSDAEIEADAKALLASLPKQGPPAGNAGTGSKQTGATDSKSMNAFIRAAAGRGQY